MDLGLTGKVAIVTGGSRGLGFAAAQALVAEGANVVVCARGAEALQQAVVRLRAAAVDGATAEGVVADMSTEPGVASVVDAAIQKFGRLDVLVNNVAVAKGTDIETTSDAEWEPRVSPGRSAGQKPADFTNQCLFLSNERDRILQRKEGSAKSFLRKQAPVRVSRQKRTLGCRLHF